MSSQLTDDELAELLPSELLRHHTPIPTQIVSSDEFYPDPQNPQQREVESRLLAMADELGRRQGHGSAPFLSNCRRHGGGVCGHERGLRTAICGDGRRGCGAGNGAGAR